MANEGFSAYALPAIDETGRPIKPKFRKPENLVNPSMVKTCMDSRLIADRHPVLGRLYRLWLARCDGAALPLAENLTGRLADLDDVIVVIRRPAESDETPRIERSGRVVDRIFGTALAGQHIGRLTPSSDHAENEAALVFASSRTLMMEDQVELPGGPARLARLYLPLADANGEVTAIMVGVAKIS